MPVNLKLVCLICCVNGEGLLFLIKMYAHLNPLFN